jgi:hypothetical protein
MLGRPEVSLSRQDLPRFPVGKKPFRSVRLERTDYGALSSDPGPEGTEMWCASLNWAISATFRKGYKAKAALTSPSIGANSSDPRHKG